MRSDYVGTGGRIIMAYYVYDFSVYLVALSNVVLIFFLSTHLCMTLKSTCDVPALCLGVVCR